MDTIQANVRTLLQSLPSGVELVVVGKGRSSADLFEAVQAGARIIGENYVQEAARAREVISTRVEWHFIGHLQRNKVKQTAALFDMIETVDSLRIAAELDGRCAAAGKTMPVLIEVNSGREPSKAGALPDDVLTLAEAIARLPHLRLTGLMTMGPAVITAEDARPFFALTRRLSESIRQRRLPDVEMKYLSMGTTDTYKVAIEEGANLVRIGRGIFG